MVLAKVTNTIRIGILLVVCVWALIIVYLWHYSPGFTKVCFLPGCQEGGHGAGGQGRMVNGSLQYPSRNLTSTVHVCIASDENTLGGMIVAINSVYRNTKNPVHFHLITDQTSEQHLRAWIMKTSLKDIHYEIKVFPEEWVKNKIKVEDARPELANPLNFARFYIPKLFPQLTGKILYIDDDSVVQGDVSQLVKSVFLKKEHVAAVSDDCTAMSKRFSILKNFYIHYINFKHHKIANLNMKRTTCSFNSGVFVFDIDRWKTQLITENLDQWMALNKKENVFGDEKGGGSAGPPMMIVLYNKTAQLDPNWNVRFLGTSSSMQKYSVPFLKSAKLLHWTGPDKPWNGKSPYSDLWEKWYIPDPTKKFKVIKKSGLLK